MSWLSVLKNQKLILNELIFPACGIFYESKTDNAVPIKLRLVVNRLHPQFRGILVAHFLFNSAHVLQFDSYGGYFAWCKFFDRRSVLVTSFTFNPPVIIFISWAGIALLFRINCSGQFNSKQRRVLFRNSAFKDAIGSFAIRWICLSLMYDGISQYPDPVDIDVLLRLSTFEPDKFDPTCVVTPFRE